MRAEQLGETLLEKGFPQLLDKHTPMNTDLSY
jgi:hypothetical protein